MPNLDEMLSGMTDENRHDEFPIGEYTADYSRLTPEQIAKDDPALAELHANSCPAPVLMPRELTDRQADAALAATASWLDVKGSALTVNREKMKARYRSLVKFIESGGAL